MFSVCHKTTIIKMQIVQRKMKKTAYSIFESETKWKIRRFEKSVIIGKLDISWKKIKFKYVDCIIRIKDGK